MASQVIKKDGRREPFDAEKIRNSIAAATERANLPEERRNEIVEQVSTAAIQLADAEEEIATSEIKEKILSELDRIEPGVSEAWRKHEEEKGKGEGGEVAEGEEVEGGEEEEEEIGI